MSERTWIVQTVHKCDIPDDVEIHGCKIKVEKQNGDFVYGGVIHYKDKFYSVCIEIRGDGDIVSVIDGEEFDRADYSDTLSDFEITLDPVREIVEDMARDIEYEIEDLAEEEEE